MSRLVFSASTDRTVPGDALEISLGTVTRTDGVERVEFTVPPYPPDAASKLLSVTICYGPGAPADGITPEDYMAACQPTIGRLDVSGQFGGYTGTIDVQGVPAGSVQFIQSILEFDV
jgi:hypothetical protein